jgi:hypothetical protein
LAEGLKAAEWEKVICVAYNIKAGMTPDDAKSKVGWESKYNPFLGAGSQIVNNTFTTFSKDGMDHYGSGSAELTDKWDRYFVKMTGKSASAPTKTPKTDMILGNKNISLKKYGGSQLMSGGASETLATLAFAYDNAPDSIKTTAFDTAWNKLNADIERDFLPSFKLGARGSGFSKIGEISKQSGISALKTKVITAMTNDAAMTQAIRDIMETNEIKYEIVKEAMTGNSKFATSEAIATYMMKFDVDGSGEFKKITDSVINQYTKNTQFNISFKTSGTGGRAWTALKGIYKEENKILDDILTESIVETDQEFEFLGEGIFDLAKGVVAKGKEITGNIAKKIQAWVKKFLIKVWNKIKAVLVKGLDLALNLLNKKIVVRGEGYSFRGGW